METLSLKQRHNDNDGRNSSRTKLKKFHNCICRTPPHDRHDHCDFNMLETDYNATVLEGCLKNKNTSEKARLTYRSEEFHCHLRNDFTIRCHPKQGFLEDKDTTFLSILVCLSSALESIECDRSGRTIYRHGLTTTLSPNVSTAMSLKLKLVFLSMTVVLGLLLGILGTVCCVFCWRQRKKRSVPTTSIVKRTGPRVPQNTYEHRPQDNTIYEELPDTEVPDLLQQGPRSVIRSTEDVSDSVCVHSNLQSVTYKPGGQGYYEALARRTDEKELGSPGTSKPVPAPRTTIQPPRRLSSGHNDYLDLEEGSKQTDGTQPNVSNPYFVLESSADTSPTSPEPSGHTDGGHTTWEDENTQTSSTTGRRDEEDDECCSKSSSLGGSDVHDYQKLQRPTLTSESRQGDGYECPLSPDSGFDLATTYHQSEEDRQTTCSPDYLRLTGPAVQQLPLDSVEPETKHDYFVLENEGKT
ncbi:uncharacterized protein LOC124287831 isoform X2 [Haliotis rubra]|uniref:uncharacterized protein LOC124287831 isoform X2 n=1 Tax=Haliotis rubra TaxID=36100 RepID=UPI001EE5FCDD|nr:uncharacterized protein LOC124287831 isoform X2 [Haliotis rubra]